MQYHLLQLDKTILILYSRIARIMQLRTHRQQLANNEQAAKRACYAHRIRQLRHFRGAKACSEKTVQSACSVFDNRIGTVLPCRNKIMRFILEKV